MLGVQHLPTPWSLIVIRRILRGLQDLPSYAAISGGWRALFRQAVQVLKREGLRGFWIKLSRLQTTELPPKGDWPGHVEVDVQRYAADSLPAIAAGLGFEPVEKPQVTIVIPVFNQLALTLECLAAMRRHPQRTRYEVIVVDDCSSDLTASLLPPMAGLSYLRNAENRGYLLSCNRALTHARGEFIHFLNNDTQVQAGWLDALMDRMVQSPGVAVVGSMLLFPDGTLQESGAMLVSPRDPAWGRLTGELIGMKQSPLHPDYAHAREVEYCSGASLLVRRSLLESLGGLDARFAPAYFEDADLAYAARAAGWKVYVEPRSKVVHHLSASTQAQPGRKLELVQRNSERFVEKWQSAWRSQRRIRTIAIYLPQFHPIPENDAWWGAGFTEWTNVRKARPNFEGHVQPQQPGELGYYDLRDAKVRERQASLAREHGIDAFCYYYYWFDGQRLLHRPLDEVLSSGQPDFPFCVCWANENWTRTWDGQESHVLIQQNHSHEDDVAFIESLFAAFRDHRYLRVHGKPMLLIYKVGLLPDIRQTARRWRAHCRQHGIGEIYLACVHNSANPELNVDPTTIGFDAAVEFPPSGKGVPAATPEKMLNPSFRGRFYSYTETAANFLRTPAPPYPLLRTVMPAWDNTARRQDAGHIFLGASPQAYAEWLTAAADWTDRLRVGDERLLFINAWNEWAEGNHLEPDLQHGRAYLEATRSAILRYRT